MPDHCSIFTLISHHPFSFLSTQASRNLRIDVAFTPDELHNIEIGNKSVLVVDILRASSTITTAIVNGASVIIPVNSPEEAFRLFDRLERQAILGGERNNKRVEGFHMGNSLAEYSSDAVSGKSVIFCTTNGTKTIKACKSAHQVFIGCFLNQYSVCKQLVISGNDILILCSGKKGRFCIEDTVFAGACVKILGKMLSASVSKSDSAVAAEILYQHHSADILGMLRNTEHGKSLIETGFADDLSVCAQVDVTDVVPVYQDGKIKAR